MALLNEAALKRIESVIADVEQRTAGEIVVVSVPASDGYAEARMMFSAAMALLLAAIAHVIWPTLAVWSLLYVQLGVAALSWLISGLPGVLRKLVPSARATESVERRAREEFLEHGVFATRDRTGVLMLISELEHRVVILGDKGIDAYVHKSGWDHHVQTIIAAIRKGQAADGLCTVIAEIGDVLAGHLPVRTDDQNELPNIVRQENR